MDIRGIQFLKSNFNPPNWNNFRDFLVLIEAILLKLGEIQFLKTISARGNGFSGWWEPFLFSIFQESPANDKSFRLIKKLFLNKILLSGQWKRILWLVKTVFFCFEFFAISGNLHLI